MTVLLRSVQFLVHGQVTIIFVVSVGFFVCLYTDGSKMGNKVAAAVVHGNVTKTTRLPNKASIFRAEL